MLRGLLLTSMLFSLSAFSLNCQETALQQNSQRAQKGRLKLRTSVAAIKALIEDFKKIDLSLKNSSTPRNYLNNCRQKKEEILFQYVKHINPAAYEKASFNNVMGDLYLYKQQYQKALKHFDKASTLRVNNFYDLQKAWKVYYYNWNRDFAQTSDISEALPSKKKFIQGALKRLNDLIEHPEANTESKINFLTARALIYKNENKAEQERSDWARIIELNPKHLLALKELSGSLYQLNMHKEAKSILIKLTRHPQSQETHHTQLLNTLLELKEASELLKHARIAQKRFPQNLTFASFQSRALFLQNRLQEAENINTAVLRKSSKNKLAIENSALILEKKADHWMSKKTKFAHALASYQKALELFPRRSLKEKMAKVLYEYRKGLDFKPFQVSKIDLQQALDLLEEQINEEHLSEKTLSLYVLSAKEAKEHRRGERACQKYFDLYQNAPSKALIGACLEIYRETKNLAAIARVQDFMKKTSPPRQISSETPN